MEGRSITQKNLRNYCCDHGIKHQFTQAWTPQQNEILERKNKIIMDIARSMLFKNNAPKSLWSEAINTTNYLVNRLPTQVNQGMILLQVFTSRKPNLHHLHIFDCKVHVHVPWEN
jgi:hypothetical protein